MCMQFIFQCVFFFQPTEVISLSQVLYVIPYMATYCNDDTASDVSLGYFLVTTSWRSELAASNFLKEFCIYFIQ